ncbi:hypothetical protein ASE14_11265 [Agromyces sp. Root81]|uniref:hypothetical protein n=1 Tax=Agromyces sp. Root81 TaxID=1736601 RepID=UPI0006F780C3|nr:hypothetical protein [Agromyces sp. Root81]KRC61442.1 hypothetical protein ASE14_11265 [Agromyces sp. Root81]
MTDSVRIDESQVDVAVEQLRLTASAWALHGTVLAIGGLGPELKDEATAATAVWVEEFRTVGDGLMQMAQEIEDDLTAFQNLDIDLASSGREPGGGRRAAVL